MVKRGDVLLEIDATELQNQIAAAENEFATSQANLTKAQADVSLGDAADALAMEMAQHELSNAEAGMRWWEQADGKNMLTGAELTVKMSRDRVEDEGDELDQLKKMYKSEELTNATDDIVVKRAIRGLEQAKIRQGMTEASAEKIKSFDYSTARQKLVFGIEKERQELAALKAQQEQGRVLRQTAQISAKLGLEKAQMKLSELKEDLNAFSVKAPHDGMVVYGQLNRGSWQNSDPRALRPDDKITAGNVVITVVTPGKLRLIADVPESRIGMVKSGQKARVVPVGLSDANTNGTTATPSPVGMMREVGQVFPTVIELEKIDPRLTPGGKALVRIDAGKAESVLVIPSSAVQRSRVKVRASDGEEKWKFVVTGRGDGETVEILEGLSEGDQVLEKPSK
jgi:multidrug efflux pump subunit AcrA (membrane-fusion protein)